MLIWFRGNNVEMDSTLLIMMFRCPEAALVILLNVPYDEP